MAIESGPTWQRKGSERLEAKVVAEGWKTKYNTAKPHNLLKLPASCSRGIIAKHGEIYS